ncbi:MAG: DUF2905 domain-containing protein [Pseudomonadota bacterium]|nr:DUF2905 domain-containing protein [Pseudomonadota bacterium]
MFYLGVLLIVLSQLLPFLLSMGLGKLPGDIFLQSKDGHSSFYFPWVSCIVISVVISLLANWFSKS